MTDGNHNRDLLISLDNDQKSGPEAALVAPNAFYRSKVLTVNHGVNPMLSASASLFSIISQCQQLPHQVNLTKLQQELTHEIFSFESTVQTNSTHSEKTILAARYALCAFIDETMQRALGDDSEQWQPLSLLHRFHGQMYGGQQFYMFLERAMADPTLYLDLLELYYMCLSLGYQGKYGESSQGFLIREHIVNRLYQIIQEQRGEFSRSVMVGTEQAPPTITPKRVASKSVMTLSLMAIMTIGGIVLNEFYSVQDTNQSVQQAMTHLLHSRLDTTDITLVPQPR